MNYSALFQRTKYFDRRTLSGQYCYRQYMLVTKPLKVYHYLSRNIITTINFNGKSYTFNLSCDQPHDGTVFIELRDHIRKNTDIKLYDVDTFGNTISRSKEIFMLACFFTNYNEMLKMINIIQDALKMEEQTNYITSITETI